MIVKLLDKDLEKFISSLDKTTTPKVLRLIDLLERFGNQLSLPYSRKISNNLFELRARGKQEVRIFYTFYRKSAVLLHGFVKKTQKTPAREIEMAKNKSRRLTKI